MLHIITPLYRYGNLPEIYSSIPQNDDVVWHIAKTSRREKLVYDFITSDTRIKLYEIDCEDNDLITKRNTVFDNIKDGQFHLLDDDTIFHPIMYHTYKKYENFDGMIIGKQLEKDISVRLKERYPSHGLIDTGNVLCHSSILDKVKWEERKGYEKLNCKDFIFWDNCFKIFKRNRTKLIPESVSIYNAIR